MNSRAGGFTLIEVLAVTALVALVFTVALDFFTDLSNASARASDHTRDVRRATAILDRVARDFESAYLIADAPGEDPLFNPYIFVAESRFGGAGADHIKFVTRNHDATRTDNPESDEAMVAYMVDADDDEHVTLYRWSSPQLPESADRSFPSLDDEGVFPMAEGLGSFAVRLLSEAGEAEDSWDSTTLEQSSTLPLGVEIELSMEPGAMLASDDPEGEGPVTYSRRVLIPVRPLDLAALLESATANAGAGADEDGDGEPDGDGDDDESGSSGQQANEGGLTTGRCIIAGSASDGPFCNALLGLARSNPSMPFTPTDAASLAAQCPSFIAPQCR